MPQNGPFQTLNIPTSSTSPRYKPNSSERPFYGSTRSFPSPGLSEIAVAPYRRSTAPNITHRADTKTGVSHRQLLPPSTYRRSPDLSSVLLPNPFSVSNQDHHPVLQLESKNSSFTLPIGSHPVLLLILPSCHSVDIHLDSCLSFPPPSHEGSPSILSDNPCKPCTRMHPAVRFKASIYFSSFLSPYHFPCLFR